MGEKRRLTGHSENQYKKKKISLDDSYQRSKYAQDEQYIQSRESTERQVEKIYWICTAHKFPHHKGRCIAKPR